MARRFDVTASRTLPGRASTPPSSQLRSARGPRTLEDVARGAGISPETLRKIETGRLPSPAFGTIVGLSDALGLPLETLAAVWRPATAAAS